jgi:hypothetical protein
MLRKIILGTCIATFGILLGMRIPAQSSEATGNTDISLLLGFSAARVELLHRLMIGEVSSVKQSLARDIAYDVKAFSNPESKQKLSTDELERLDKLMILLAVMQEQMNVDSWREESEFLATINAEAKSNPKLAATFRCKDWSKPMWVDDDCK